MDVKRFCSYRFESREVVVINVLEKSVSVAPVLARKTDSPLCVQIEENRFLHLEQLFMVENKQLGKRLKTINAKIVRKTVNKLFGNCRFEDDRVECLCEEHLAKKKNAAKWVVRRVDPFERHKSKCFYCSNEGYKYSIVKKGE